MDDSQSLHRKWLFHQTSIYKWLFGVPGRWFGASNHPTFLENSLAYQLGIFLKKNRGNPGNLVKQKFMMFMVRADLADFLWMFVRFKKKQKGTSKPRQSPENLWTATKTSAHCFFDFQLPDLTWSLDKLDGDVPCNAQDRCIELSSARCGGLLLFCAPVCVCVFQWNTKKNRDTLSVTYFHNSIHMAKKKWHLNPFQQKIKSCTWKCWIFHSHVEFWKNLREKTHTSSQVTQRKRLCWFLSLCKCKETSFQISTNSPEIKAKTPQFGTPQHRSSGFPRFLLFGWIPTCCSKGKNYKLPETNSVLATNWWDWSRWSVSWEGFFPFFRRKNVSFREGTWRIIPVSKWLVTPAI